MTKREAREMAHRIAAGTLEQFMQSREPLTYDWLAGDKEHEGKRLSDADEYRVDEALEKLIGRLYEGGNKVFESFKAHDGKRTLGRPDGKPGARWKKHAERQKRWGAA